MFNHCISEKLLALKFVLLVILCSLSASLH